jgi:antitoxin CptB
MNSNKQNFINKIKYRSLYRGSKEMDIFVSSFVENIINDLNFNELEHLNSLINLNDEEIINVSKGLLKVNIDEKIINLLINFKKK